MAACILTQDLLGIFLLFAGGNTSERLGGILRVAEEYQELCDRHFGISRSDLRGLFMMFTIDVPGRSMAFEELDQLELKEIIPDILRYHEAHFNDEGEHWSMPGKVASLSDYDDLHVETWYNYDRKQFRWKVQVKRMMKAFFADEKNHRPGQVMDFLAKVGIDESLLIHCSRPGAQS